MFPKEHWKVYPFIENVCGRKFDHSVGYISNLTENECKKILKLQFNLTKKRLKICEYCNIMLLVAVFKFTQGGYFMENALTKNQSILSWIEEKIELVPVFYPVVHTGLRIQ